MEDKDGYVYITLEEFRELLIIKGKYEELKGKESSTIQYIPYTPNIQPLTYPYPDVVDTSPKVTFATGKMDLDDNCIKMKKT